MLFLKHLNIAISTVNLLALLRIIEILKMLNYEMLMVVNKFSWLGI